MIVLPFQTDKYKLRLCDIDNEQGRLGVLISNQRQIST